MQVDMNRKEACMHNKYTYTNISTDTVIYIFQNSLRQTRRVELAFNSNR